MTPDFPMNNQRNEIKQEKNAPGDGDDLTSIECSMSIIDPKSIAEKKITAAEENPEGMNRFLKRNYESPSGVFSPCLLLSSN